MKKIYLILFFLTLAIGIYAQSGTYTANGVEWKYELNGSEATITGETAGGNVFNKALNIPDNIMHAGNSYPVTKIGANAFKQYTKATGLHIPTGVTEIGERAFNWCRECTGNLSLSNVVSIGKEAFASCSKLTGSLHLPKLTKIEESAFAVCRGLTGTLSLPNVTSIEKKAFSSCDGFSKLIAPKVTTIGEEAFFSCTGLNQDLSLPFVTSIGPGAFNVCAGLTSIYLPIVTTIGYSAFNRCTGLKGNLSLPEVVNIGSEAFSLCTGLDGTLSLPKVTSIGGYAFFKCSNIKGSLSFPEVASVGDAAFYQCTSLNGTLSVPKATVIGSEAFLNCSGLTGALSLPNVTLVNYQAFMNCTGLTSLSMSKMERIEVEAFRGCTGLSDNINFPSSMRELGSRCFVGCTNLESITGENSLTSMFFNDQIFLGDYNLKYIDLSNVTVTPSTILSRDIASNSCFADLKPYTMVYLPQDAYSIAPNEENFVIGTTCDDFVAYDSHPDYKGGTVGCYFTIRNAFTATQASYKNRSFSGETCKTICLPYPSTVPSGMIAYELREKTGSGGYFRFVSITGNQLTANTPYLLRITDSGTHTFGTETNVQVPVTPATIEVAASADGTTFFGGKTENIDNATAAAGGYYNLINNEWRPITTANPNGYVHSFRAYIRSTSPTPAKGFAIVLDDENETTGIDNAEEDIEKGGGKIYSLDGKLLGTDVDALKSGEIYIKNGKKFYKF